MTHGLFLLFRSFIHSFRHKLRIDRVLTPGIRCTVEMDVKTYAPGQQPKGKVVSPSAPRQDNGTYWGYTTRMASSLKEALDECPYGQYDLKIGTSERGDMTVDGKSFSLPTFRHAIVVFGGVAGIEECVDADENMKIPGSQSKKLFDLWYVGEASKVLTTVTVSSNVRASCLL